MRKPKIAIITNIIPHYRQEFYDAITEYYLGNLTIYCQDKVPGVDLKTVESHFQKNVKLVKYWISGQEKIGWQFLPFSKLIKFNVVFIYGNPRIISNVVWSFVLKLFNCKVVLWGQAHTAGSNRTLEKLRLYWWRCFHNYFVYTDQEVKWLEKRGFGERNIVGMNNGLNQKKIDGVRRYWAKAKLNDWQNKMGLHQHPILLSCARLVKKNCFEKVIFAINCLIERGINPIWILIGDGPERSRLKRLSQKKHVYSNILFVGALYLEEELAPWFLSADIFVHPSAIGLSLLHAMGYGIPVVTHSNRDQHMPEFEAFVEGETGITFEEGNTADFADKVSLLLGDEKMRKRMGERAEEIVRTKYNTDVMVSRFKEMAYRVANRVSQNA